MMTPKTPTSKKAVTVVKNLSDEELNQAILKDIQPYFQFMARYSETGR